MGKVEQFEDLNVWKEARELSKRVYQISNKEFKKDFDLMRQIRRSSGSVMDNIAEGFERGGQGEFVQFLSIAKGSCGEVRSQLYRAKDQNYLNEEEFEELFNHATSVSKMLSGFIKYLRKSNIKGVKYKD